MKCKKLTALILASALALSSSLFVFADAPQEKATPATSTVTESTKTPIGELTSLERLALSNHECSSCPVPYHYSLTYHTHEITSITNQYRGEICRGVVAETVRVSNTDATLTYSQSLSVGNSCGVDISFDDSVISSTLGYNVSYSTSATASYEIAIPAGKMGSITLYDMYDVSEFDVKTTYMVNGANEILYDYEYGSGWAQQWTNFAYSGITW